MELPTIGRIVKYRSRTGNYDLPAMVVATEETLFAEGVERYRESSGQAGCPPLEGPDHVHLVVFTPGLPEAGQTADDFEAGRSRNLAGTYQEWDIPMAPSLPEGGIEQLSPEERDEYESKLPGTWRWPELRREVAQPA